MFGAQDEQSERETATRLVELAEIVVQVSVTEVEGRWTVSISIHEVAAAEVFGPGATSGIEGALVRWCLSNSYTSTPNRFDSRHGRELAINMVRIEWRNG